MTAKVLALVTDAFGGRGGIARYNRDLLSAMGEGPAVASIAVLPRQAPDADVPRTTKIVQARARAGRLAYSVSALRVALAYRPDIIFCGHLYMAPLAAALARLTRAKLIVQAHGIEAWSKPSRWQLRALQSADLILCVSRYTRQAVMAWCTIAPERAIVLPATVSEQFVPGDSAQVRKEMRLSGQRVLLTVARLDSHEQYKGHDRVIQTLGQLGAANREITYLIVGEGDDRPRLEALAHALGVHQRVRFLGSISSGDLVRVYRAADLFVMPSTGEGFGIAFVEAMAAGTLALGLDAGGARDALADGELGVVAKQADLGAAIVRCLGRNANWRALGQATRARFGRHNFTARVRDILARLEAAA